MRKISKIEPKAAAIKPKKKVAAYARVSRDTERLLHSASAQVSYYSSMIQKNPDWQYAGVPLWLHWHSKSQSPYPKM